MAKAQFTLKMDKEKLQEMKIMAIRMDMPLNQLIEWLYDQWKSKIDEYDDLFKK